MLQRELRKEMYAVRLDGLFGRNTEDAVMRFQRAHGLVDDGVVGPITWAALLGDAASGTDRESPQPAVSVPGPVAVAHLVLQAELAEAAQYQQFAAEAGRAFGISLSLIGGIGSRESRWGLALRLPQGTNQRAAGTGDFAKRSCPSRYRVTPLPPDGYGFGRGLMQIDYDFHEFARSGNWADPKANIEYACKTLADFRATIKRHASLEEAKLTRAMLASYNCGPGNVLRTFSNGRNVDFYTAGRNYSSDVLRRAEFFAANGWT